MSETNNNVETTVTKENIDIDEVFGVGAENVTLPESKPSIFSKPEDVSVDSITAPVDTVEKEEENTVAENTETEVSNETNIPNEVSEEVKEKAQDIFEDIAGESDSENEPEVKAETRGRKPISGISDVFSSLMKKEKVFGFDDDKPMDDYTPKDWEELIEANIEEAKNQVRRETPKQFFEALPNELKVAAKYVADGGTDLKGLFRTLAYVEESRDLDVSKSGDQEAIITEYLSATGYGTAEEIQEEIEVWKDLGKLEQQASKFKPKLDKMQEKVVAKKLQEQEMKKKQQDNASKQYMNNVYETLKDGKVGELKLDKKTQSMLFNGLVQPAYPSVSGKNTNLLGHLLEKYQFVEPNYNLITEALWLLSDPKGYKSKIMEKGAQKSIEKTVRKLKTEQANSGGRSLGIPKKETPIASKQSKKIQRSNNFFKRM